MTFPRLPDFFKLHESLGQEFMDNAEAMDAVNRLTGKRGSTVTCPLCGQSHAENYTLRHITSDFCISYRTQIWSEQQGLWNIHGNYSKMLSDAGVPTVDLPTGREQAHYYGRTKEPVYKNTKIQMRTHTWAWAVIFLELTRLDLSREQRVAGLSILNKSQYFSREFPYSHSTYIMHGPKAHRKAIRDHIKQWKEDDILKVLRNLK